MKIVVMPPDEGAVGHYRLVFPARVLRVQGADVTIDTIGPRVIFEGHEENHPEHEHPPPDAIVRGLAEPFDADVVVIQRPARRWWADIIPYLQATGTGVVVDLDDRLDRIHPGNVAYNRFVPGLAPDFGWDYCDRACQLADLVTVTTPALLRRFGYGHGVVLPNLVPASYLKTNATKMPETIGWAGNIEVHPEDLHATRGAVQTVLNQSGWSFHVIGTGNGVKAGLSLSSEPTNTGYLPFDVYPSAVSALEIGIVPLKLDVFNESKSSLKMSEMAALGVPVIASPTPDNLRLHKLGVGLVANSSNQWTRKMTALTKAPQYRADLAGKGREIMATQTYESNSYRWLAAWSRAARKRDKCPT